MVPSLVPPRSQGGASGSSQVKKLSSTGSRSKSHDPAFYDTQGNPKSSEKRQELLRQCLPDIPRITLRSQACKAPLQIQRTYGHMPRRTPRARTKPRSPRDAEDGYMRGGQDVEDNFLSTIAHFGTTPILQLVDAAQMYSRCKIKSSGSSSSASTQKPSSLHSGGSSSSASTQKPSSLDVPTTQSSDRRPSLRDIPVLKQTVTINEAADSSQAAADSLGEGDTSKDSENSAGPKMRKSGTLGWIEGNSLPDEDEFVKFSLGERAVIQRYFDTHDSDGSGELSGPELIKVIDDMGRKPKEGTNDARALEQLRLLADVDGSGELDFTEFNCFLASYYHHVYDRIFNEYDDDHSGIVSPEELVKLLQDLREAGFNIEWEDMQDIVKDIDKDCNGLDFTEFCDLMRRYRMLEFVHLQKNAGFDSSKLMYLQAAFESADEDCSGSLGIKELVGLMEKTSLVPPLEGQDDLDKFVELFARIDKDRSASLDFEEFLQLVRVWGKQCDREAEEQGKDKAQREVKRLRTQENKNLHRQKTSEARMIMLGYENDEKAEEIAKDLRTEGLMLDVEDGILAHEWGVSIPFVRALRESFEYSDADGSNNLDQEELIPLLKNLDSEPSTTKQKGALSECLAKLAASHGEDDGTLKLTFALVVQLIVEYNDILAHDIFVSSIPEGKAGIPSTKLILAFYQAGHYLKKQAIEELLSDCWSSRPELDLDMDDPNNEIDEATFKQLMAIHQKKRLLAWRQTCGFDKHDIDQFRDVCKVFREEGDPDDGSVRLDKVLSVLAALEKNQDIDHLNDSERKTLSHALMRVDRVHSGRIAFEELLLLLRHLKNREQEFRVQGEKKACEALGLENSVLAQFRKVFQEKAGGTARMLSRVEVRELLSTLGMVMDGKQKKLLNQVFTEVFEKTEEEPSNPPLARTPSNAGTPKDSGTPSNSHQITFAQFLWVLHGLRQQGAF